MQSPIPAGFHQASPVHNEQQQPLDGGEDNGSHVSNKDKTREGESENHKNVGAGSATTGSSKNAKN